MQTLSNLDVNSRVDFCPPVRLPSASAACRLVSGLGRLEHPDDSGYQVTSSDLRDLKLSVLEVYRCKCLVYIHICMRSAVLNT